VEVARPATARSQQAAQIPRDEHEPAPDRWGEVFGDDIVAAAMIDNRSRNGFVCVRSRGVVASQQVSCC